MDMLGIKMTLLIGPTVPVPAPILLTENIDRVEVNQSDQGRSGFQIVFRAGRSGVLGALEYPLLANPLLLPNNRVIIMVLVNALPRVLIDGLVTHQQLNPGTTPGSGTLTITGEDVSVAMDRDKVKDNHPAQNELIIMLKLVGKYAQYGLLPQIMPPFMIDFPLPVERIPAQNDTDLKYAQTMAQRFGYVFYIRPGPVPGTNTAYWGPQVRLGLPARALSVNLGHETNVNNIDFQYDSREAVRVDDVLRDRTLNTDLPVMTFFSTRLPPLATMPPLPFELPNVRKVTLDQAEGLSYAQAYARAQATTNSSMDNVLTATGEVDSARYGDVMEARGLVGVRGAGYSHDGLYYIKSVKHSISRGQYKQQFTLTREGRGATLPVVRP
ncbi:MAG: hypothetical protein OEW08_01245 [Gammaproteobacteria bacterium]|nr:hypothetical protein [Gammaproteobacteria bacterium]